jgi:hypothetical protein
MANNPWASGTGKVDYYSTSTRSEVDMRQEFINTMSGKFPELPKGQTGLLRRVRRTSSGKLIECPCVDNITREPDKDTYCPICMGMSYLWDESYILFYKTVEGVDRTIGLSLQPTQPGLLTGEIVVFYVRYDVSLDEKDFIVEINLDTEGEPVTPLTRTRLYRIAKVWEFRADYGRIEYKKIYVQKDNTKYLNAPGFGEG